MIAVVAASIVAALTLAGWAVHTLRTGTRHDRDLPDWHDDQSTTTDPGGHCRIVYRGTPR